MTIAEREQMTVLSTIRRLDGRTPLGGDAVGSKKMSSPVKVPCGTIWPNGEFGLGYTVKHEEADALQPDLAGGCSIAAIRAECERVTEGAQPLDLTSLPNSRKLPSNRPETYGRKGMTNRGAKMVRNAAHLLERDHGRQNLTFLTLTLPEMSKEASVAVASDWGKLVNRLLEWLGRRLSAQGLPSSVVSVTEVQSMRFASGSHSVLHVHAVFVGRKPGKTWAVKVKDVRQWWLSALGRIVGSDVESLSCCDMKRVEKSAGNYLSKYMTKGTAIIAEFAERLGWDAVPRQWWNCTSRMRSQVKRECLTGESVMTVLDQLVYGHYSGEYSGIFKFVRAIEVKATEYQSFVVGFWGRLTSDSWADLADLTAGLKCD